MKKRDAVDENSVEHCARLIEEANSIAVLTGAGISTGAGIPDFRGPQGLYVTRKYDPDRVFDINAFYEDPKPFFEFARDFLELEKTIKPTFTHFFLAGLEKKGKLKGTITQNIDSLHQLAGSKNVLELHGSFWQSFCIDCGRPYTFEETKRKVTAEFIPTCDCQGVIKPDIVFFGENVKQLDEAFRLAHDADLFFIIGTSCVVYPAAMVPQYAQGKIAIINQTDIALDPPNVALIVKEDIDQFFRKVAGYEK